MVKMPQAARKSLCNLRSTHIAPIRWNLILVKTKMKTSKIMTIHPQPQVSKVVLVKMKAGKTREIRNRSSLSRETTFKNRGRGSHSKIQILANRRQRRTNRKQWLVWMTFPIYKVKRSKISNNKMMTMILLALMILAMTTATSMSNNRIIVDSQMLKSTLMILKMRKEKASRLR